jgi:hypothetical protein
MEKSEDVKFGSIIFDSKGRYLEFLIENTWLLPHKVALRSIHRKLMINKDFLNFGGKKVIMLFSKLDNGSTITFHPNVFITNTTSFNDYYKSIENYIQMTYDNTTLYGNIDQILEFKLLVWNLDNIQNKNIKLTLNNPNKIFLRKFHSNPPSFHQKRELVNPKG